ncbi:ATP-binding protein [Rhodococcus sp. 3Y1]
MGPPSGKPRRVRAVGDREDVPTGGTRSPSRRGRVEGRLVHPGRPRGPARRHRADDTVSKAIARVLRADLVVVDDIGLLPVAQDAAEGLYRLVDAAYEKRSVAISSNLHPSGFDELMPKTLATATVDRLLHHAHVCQTSGDSVRLTQALAGRGVSPLS